MNEMTKDAFSCALNDWTHVLEAAQSKRNALVVAVVSKAIRQGLSFQKFEAQTGLQHRSIMLMIWGVPQFATLFDHAIEPLAKFLGWPPVVVKAMAGQVRIEDFYTPSEMSEQPEKTVVLLDAPDLRDVSKTVALFARLLACIDSGHRRALRSVCVDGPAEWN